MAPRDSQRSRLLAASPMILIAVATVIAFDPLTLMKSIKPLATSEDLSYKDGTVRIKGKITGIKPLDFWLNANTVIFTPSLLAWDPVSQTQSRQLSLDLGILYVIFLIEGARRANASNIAGKPNLVAMASQLLTIGVIGPIYFFYHYVYCAPMERLSTPDQRYTNPRYTKTILPAVLLSYFVPFVMMTQSASTPDRQVGWMMIWQFYPLWGAVFQYLIATIFLGRFTSQSFGPLRVVSSTIAIAGIISARSWWNVLTDEDHSLRALFIPHSQKAQKVPLLKKVIPAHPPAPVPHYMLHVRKIFQVDQIAPFAAALIWLGLMYRDMLRAGVIKSTSNLLTYFAIGVATAVFAGPGAAVALGYWYRETLLINSKAPADKKRS